MADECDHGNLKRKCPICERDEEIERLRRQRDTLARGFECASEGYMTPASPKHDPRWHAREVLQEIAAENEGEQG